MGCIFNRGNLNKYYFKDFIFLLKIQCFSINKAYIRLQYKIFNL